MSRRQEIDVARHLAGEGGPEERRAFEARLAADPGLARQLERRRRLWEGLELPPPAPAPPGFAARVAARARAAAAGDFAPLPGWARAAAGVALVAGTLAGVGLGRFASGATEVATASAAGAEVWEEEESLAASYLAATASEESPNGVESPQ